MFLCFAMICETTVSTVVSLDRSASYVSTLPFTSYPNVFPGVTVAMTLYPSAINFSTQAFPRLPAAPVMITVFMFYLFLFIQINCPGLQAGGENAEQTSRL